MTREGEDIRYPTEKEVLPGPETTMTGIGPMWANVSNTPLRYWKRRVYEGGISTGQHRRMSHTTSTGASTKVASAPPSSCTGRTGCRPRRALLLSSRVT